MPLSDLLAQRRPHPADAERNFDAILTPARAAFTQNGDRFGHSPWRQSARQESWRGASRRVHAHEPVATRQDNAVRAAFTMANARRAR
jgi:hypothetical protein